MGTAGGLVMHGGAEEQPRWEIGLTGRLGAAERSGWQISFFLADLVLRNYILHATITQPSSGKNSKGGGREHPCLVMLAPSNAALLTPSNVITNLVTSLHVVMTLLTPSNALLT